MRKMARSVGFRVRRSSRSSRDLFRGPRQRTSNYFPRIRMMGNRLKAPTRIKHPKTNRSQENCICRRNARNPSRKRKERISMEGGRYLTSRQSLLRLLGIMGRRLRSCPRLGLHHSKPLTFHRQFRWVVGVIYFIFLPRLQLRPQSRSNSNRRCLLFEPSRRGRILRSCPRLGLPESKPLTFHRQFRWVIGVIYFIFLPRSNSSSSSRRCLQFR